MTRKGSQRMIGPYRIESLLGRGGMGEAFRAWDQRLGRHVAMKQVRNDGSNARRRARFRREARTAAQLTHPSVVQVYDLLEEPDGDWIVMELVHGESLEGLLRDGPLEPQRAITLGLQIAEGLAAAHQNGIVHRDLKTENVMIDPGPPERAKILDFGLAKYVASDPGEPSISERGQVLGTARAMSPEQARGFEVDPRSDLFSLGIVLYEMSTGVSPFLGETFMDTLSRVVSYTPDPASAISPDLPEDFCRLIDQLLQKAPELRPANASQVAGRLFKLTVESGASAEARVPATETRIEPGSDLPEASQENRQGNGQGKRARQAAVASGDGWRPDDAQEAGRTFELEKATLELEPSGAEQNSSARSWLSRSSGRGVRRWMLPAAVSATVVAGVLVGALAIGIGPTWWPSEKPEPEIAAPVDAMTLDPEAAYERGAALLKNFHRPGNVDQAVKIFLRLADLNDNSAPAYAGLAAAYWRKFEDVSKSRDPMFLQQAEAAAEEAVRLDPYLADARTSRGRVYTEQGRFDEAEADFELARQLDPSDPEVWYAYGRFHQVADRLEPAIESYSKGLELAPDDRRMYDALGGVYFRLSRYDEAEQMFEQSVERVPDNVYGYRNLAAVYHVRGRYTEAAAMLQKALKIRPDAALYSNLGLIFFIQGLYSRAADTYEKALNMAGSANDPLFWANLADAYRWVPGKRQESTDAYLRALQLIKTRLELQPSNSVLLSRRALYLAKIDRSEAALKVLEELTLEAPALGNPALEDPALEDPAPRAQMDLFSLFRCAITYELLGRRDAALDLLEEAFSRGFTPSEVAADPELRELRADPEYHRILLQIEKTADG